MKLFGLNLKRRSLCYFLSSCWKIKKSEEYSKMKHKNSEQTLQGGRGLEIGLSLQSFGIKGRVGKLWSPFRGMSDKDRQATGLQRLAMASVSGERVKQRDTVILASSEKTPHLGTVCSELRDILWFLWTGHDCLQLPVMRVVLVSQPWDTWTCWCFRSHCRVCLSVLFSVHFSFWYFSISSLSFYEHSQNCFSSMCTGLLCACYIENFDPI